MLALLWSRFGGWVAALGAVLAAFGAAYLEGRREGMRKIEAKQAEARDRAAKARKEIDDDVGKASRADLDRRNSGWMRDD